MWGFSSGLAPSGESHRFCRQSTARNAIMDLKIDPSGWGGLAETAAVCQGRPRRLSGFSLCAERFRQERQEVPGEAGRLTKGKRKNKEERFRR
jgi:hypothetical protein